jgi:hypothetical protein
MRVSSMTLAVAAMVVAALAGAARAGDFCIQVGPSDPTKYVAKSFKVPSAGKCKTWNGVYLPSFAPVSVSTGTACTSSDGANLRINLVTSRETVAFNDYIVLPLPSLAGGTLDEMVPQFGPSVLHITGISAAKCEPSNVPIP